MNRQQRRAAARSKRRGLEYEDASIEFAEAEDLAVHLPEAVLTIIVGAEETHTSISQTAHPNTLYDAAMHALANAHAILDFLEEDFGCPPRSREHKRKSSPTPLDTTHTTQ